MATTQVQQRQIADGAINDNKVAAGAGIQTNKLAEGAEFVKRSGSVAFTGDQSAGGNKITNLQTGSSNGDAVNVGQLNSAIAALNSMFDNKPSVRAATTANGTLATAYAAGQTIDGVSLATGDRLLIKNQSAPAENGIYTVNASGAPTRALDMDAWNEVPGAFVAVEDGSLNAATIWLCTSKQGGTINTTAITWLAIPTTAGLLNTNFVDKETPAGSINGSNTSFTLANTPVLGSEHVYLNGVLQDSGAGNDYTISGSIITMNIAPFTSEKIKVSYRK